MPQIFANELQRARRCAVSCAIAAMLALPPATASAAPEDGEADSHAGHHGGHGDHAMEPWMYDALRDKVDLYKTYSDAEIDLSMVMMGPNYEAYLSDDAVRGPVGVLTLAHGYGEKGDEVFRNKVGAIAADYHTAVGFGMSMVTSAHIQRAVDLPTGAGAETIVVVPVLSSPFNTQMRQWEYMFGVHDNAGYLETPRIETEAEVVIGSTLADHPVVVSIMTDNARKVSTDPANESLLVVSHGPSYPDDNAKTLELLEKLATAIKAEAGFADAGWVSLQNDSPPEIRDANVKRMQAFVRDANAEGRRAVIVSNLIAPRTIQNQIREALAGLDYGFNTGGLNQHPLFEDWLRANVAEAVR